jgi:hypothetical protein
MWSRLLLALPVVFIVACTRTESSVAPHGDVPYKMELQGAPVVKTVAVNGKNTSLVTVKFKITQQGLLATNLGDDYVVRIFEENKQVAQVKLPRPQASGGASRK